MTNGLQMKLMFDVAAFGVLETKKFPARGEVVKKRPHFHLRSRRFTAVAHNFDLAAVDDNYRSRDRACFACGQAKSRHAGDARKGFTAKSECGNGSKIGGRANLTGGVAAPRKEA